MARGIIRQRSKIRKDSWTVQVYMGVDPKTGKKRYHSVAVRGTKALAQRRLTELLRQIDLGTFKEPSRVTVSEYLEQWLSKSVKGRVSNRTLQSYRGNVDRYLIPKLGKCPLEKLTARQVEQMESELLQCGGRKGRPLSPRTVLQVHRVLSKAINDALRLGLVPRNVVAAVKPPRVTRYEAETLGWDEVHSFLENITDPLYQSLVVFAIQTGLRRSAILGMQWRDVDLSAGTLAVRRALIKLPSGETELNAPKNGQGRVVDLLDESVESLKALQQRRCENSENGNFVFCHSDGSPLDPDQVTQTFKRIAIKAGLAKFRFHDLRHTHASLMLAKGIHLKIVSERLGHTSIAITADLYSHVLPSVQRDAVSQFGSEWRKRNGKRMANSEGGR